MSNDPYPQKKAPKKFKKTPPSQKKTNQQTKTKNPDKKYVTKKSPAKFTRLVWALLFLKQKVTLYL